MPNFRGMKNWSFILIYFIVLIACKKDDPQQPDPCLPYVLQPGWAEEIFHGDTFIQFPGDYEGGRGGFEGPIFFKDRKDHGVLMWYAFCGPLICDDYGQTLLNPDSAFVKARPNIFFTDSVTLTQRKEICDDLITVGIYFYKDSVKNIGKLYWYTDHAFKEALNIEYDPLNKDEVEQILQTIY